MTLLRAALTSPFKRGGGGPGAALPADRAVRPPAPVAPGPLAAYRRVCGFPDTDELPLTYPHVLGFPLALRLMTARRFPLPVVGLVHTWIEITCHRPPHPADPLELTVYADGLSPHRRGTEVTMVTEARLAGEMIWESRSGYLSRHSTNTRHAANTSHDTSSRPARNATDAPDAPDTAGTAGTAGTTGTAGARATSSGPTAAVPDVTGIADAPGAPAAPGPSVVAEWRLPADLGRRYGAVSGDRNPIHLYPLTARLLGFPRPIAHGMWTVARCLAEAPASGTIRRVRADFRAPVPLPATVTYAADATGFQLRGAGRVHLTATTDGPPGPPPAPAPATDGLP
ncbi:MaoC/PaaZ C-terminal domain-containing protein [Streptomyces sp. NPDC000927]|uniref:MaoC family dehydratase n=1 Tax=Streptomyces sp. NPDC000927 TaxID=3154371 RepID=UPI00332DD9CF